MKKRSILCAGIMLVLAAIAVASLPLHAQPRGTNRKTPTPPPAGRDTLRVDTSRAVPPLADSLKAANDSARVDSLGSDSLDVSVDQSGVDTVVVYTARDIEFDADSMQLHLYGSAELIKGQLKLNAHYIRVDFKRSELYAAAAFDSATKKYSDIPQLHDGTQDLSAKSLTYNFRTQRGTLSAAETKMADGFYYAAKSKQVAPNTYFVQDGRYTTCTAPHPHYFFASPRMKVVTGDRVFADQVALYISDVPVFYIPFGVYFPSKTGRQSGLLIPRFSQTTQRGFTLEDLGYFFDINEYVDTRLNVDLYSKGGYTFRNATRFRWRGMVEQSDLNLTYGRVRDDVDDEFTSSYIIDYYHQMPVGRRGRLGGSLHFLTKDALRNTQIGRNPIETDNALITQNVTSDFSYSTSWDWGSMSAGYRSDQNIRTDEILRSVPLTISFPAITPFASGGDDFLSRMNFSLGGSISARAEFEKRDTIPGGGFRINDSRYGSTIQPSISITPRLGPINISPSISYTGSIFTRRIVKQPLGDTISTSFISGLHYAQTYGASLSISTSLYGIVQPRLFGINAIRHTLAPVVTFSFSPDFGSDEYGYYDEFFNPITNQVERYSIFERDNGVAAIPGSGRQQTVSLSLRNEFEAKIAQGDTLPDKKVRLLSLSLSTGYNAAAPNGIRWSPISAVASTELGTIGYLSGQATLDLYDRDTLGRTLPVMLIDQGKGLVRVQSANVSFGTSFSDQGFTTGASATTLSDSADAQRGRFDFEQVPFNEREFFGERVAGSRDFRIPWEIGFTGSYTLSRTLQNEFTPSFTINSTLSFSLTPTMKFTSSGYYSFEQKEFLNPRIGLVKDLECWEMRFDWVPSGAGRGFFFRIGLKASQLQDVKLERQRYYYE